MFGIMWTRLSILVILFDDTVITVLRAIVIFQNGPYDS